MILYLYPRCNVHYREEAEIRYSVKQDFLHFGIRIAVFIIYQPPQGSTVLCIDTESITYIYICVAYYVSNGVLNDFYAIHDILRYSHKN